MSKTKTSTSGITLKTLPSTSGTTRHALNRVEPFIQTNPVRLFSKPVERTESNLRGIRLLNCLRNGKVIEALELIEKDANVLCTDEAGWSAMHHAACGGFTEIIIVLHKKELDVNVVDKSEETPLHKASRRGYVEAIIALVSFGAHISVVNKEGQNPLELAVQALQVPAVETLCMLGVEVLLQDWSWTMTEDLNAKQEKLVDKLLKQHSHSSGYKHGCIVFGTAYVETGEHILMKNLDIEVNTDNVIEGYFLYCSKMKIEYSKLKDNLKNENENEIVSDIYECRLWRNKRKIIQLVLRLNLLLKTNEQLSVSSPSGQIGRVEHVKPLTTTDDESKQYSEVCITLNIRRNCETFWIVKKMMPEKFNITKQAVVLKPLAEPETEISIPKETFDSEGDLLLQIMDTKEVNKEESEGDILMTSVLDISMSNGQQPKHEIEIKIPLHCKLSANDEVVVLATSHDAPSSVDDWEVMDAKMDESGKAASFKITHFSIYAGSSKEKVKLDFPGVVSALDRSINRKKKIEFFLMTKWISSDLLLLVVEGTVPRKLDVRAKSWAKLGYNEKSLQRSNECSVSNGQRFLFTFSGNLQEVSREDSFAIIFQNNRENFRVFNICLEDKEQPCTGTINVCLENEVKREIRLKTAGPLSCCSPRKIKTKVVTESVHFQSINYEIYQPTEKQPTEKPIAKDSDAKTTPEVSNETLNKLGLFKYKVNALKQTKH